MKKWLCLLVAFVLTLSLTACGNNHNVSNQNESGTGTITQSVVSTELSESYLLILKNDQSFYNLSRQGNIFVSDYEKSIRQFAVINRDSNNSYAIAIMFDDGNILILWEDGTSVFGVDFGVHAMYQLNKDGSFLWNCESGTIYGCSKLQISGNKWEVVELWRVENSESGSAAYYINNSPASQDDFQSIIKQYNKESINWNDWTDNS